MMQPILGKGGKGGGKSHTYLLSPPCPILTTKANVNSETTLKRHAALCGVVHTTQMYHRNPAFKAPEERPQGGSLKRNCPRGEIEKNMYVRICMYLSIYPEMRWAEITRC